MACMTSIPGGESVVKLDTKKQPLAIWNRMCCGSLRSKHEANTWIVNTSPNFNNFVPRMEDRENA